MTAAEFEAHIKYLGAQMELHHAAYVVTGCFAARGSADGYRLQMERAIAARSPAAVATMEFERGLV